jgi:hypothetical protein
MIPDVQVEFSKLQNAGIALNILRKYGSCAAAGNSTSVAERCVLLMFCFVVFNPGFHASIGDRAEFCKGQESEKSKEERGESKCSLGRRKCRWWLLGSLCPNQLEIVDDAA